VDILLIARDGQGKLLVHQTIGRICGTVRGWKKEEIEVFIPEEADYVRIGLHHHREGTGAALSGVMWLDALSVVEKDN